MRTFLDGLPDRFGSATRQLQLATVAGSVERELTKAQLLEGAAHYGLDLEDIPDGYMAYHYWPTDELKFPRQVTVWDRKGRLARVDFIGTVCVNDRTGELAGEQSPLFSNVYEYDEAGRLKEFSQVVVQNDFTEYLYRGDVYTYAPDGTYTTRHIENYSDQVKQAS